ncbi:hypothetical protein CBS147332_1024 [Penicillium roqueforti]|nr:hypothetical protein CBS147332_1024 [Penicillium roqueforti]KAI3122585.1 hypothetical protein CBS147331_1035 [Penicillium roqueforti]
MAVYTRSSPLVQQIQQSSPWVDIYTDSATSPLRVRSVTHNISSVSHAHPEPRRWQNPGGWGPRHMNDTAPFTLWDDTDRKYRLPTKEEFQWISKKFGDGKISLSGWFICIATDNPPKPVPLTLGCMPVMFVGVNQSFLEPLPKAPYPNPRLPDPCPDLRWPPMGFPTDADNITVLEALEPLAHVRAVMYLPSWIIIELEYGDSRVYELKSLPGIVAGRTALYHHAVAPFHKKMKNLTRGQQLDPAESQTSLRPLPQDTHNYLQYSFLSPGYRIESGYSLSDSSYKSTTRASSAGVKLRNSKGEEALSIAYHGFPISSEVYHLDTHQEIIGDVINIRPELDVALVKLTSTASTKFKNTCYFQAQPPKTLLEGKDIRAGSWAEVDGMSSGLLNLLSYGMMKEKPVCLPGSPKIPFAQWRSFNLQTSWGVVNEVIAKGICGAPIVSCDTGGVTGFFHLFDGMNCLSATLDDLVAEGWQIA